MKTVFTRPRPTLAIQITAELRAAILGGEAELPPSVRVCNSAKCQRRWVPVLRVDTPDGEIDLQDGDWIVSDRSGRATHCPADEFDARFFTTEEQALASVREA